MGAVHLANILDVREQIASMILTIDISRGIVCAKSTYKSKASIILLSLHAILETFY